MPIVNSDGVVIPIEAVDKASAAIKKFNDELDKTDSTVNKYAKTTDTARDSQRELEEGAISNVKTALAFAKQAFDMTVGATVAYADEVRKLQQVTGASAEDTSRLIQVLDDYKVSTEQAAQAQRYLTKQGIVLTTDSLAKLSDEYINITNQADKNAFAQKNLGRNYLAFVEVLQQGGDAIRQNAASQASGLILTQKSIDQARDFQKAQDGLQDSAAALAYTFGTALLPAVGELTKYLQSSADAWQHIIQAVTEAADVGTRMEAILNAQGLATRSVHGAMSGMTVATEEQQQAAYDLAVEQWKLDQSTQAVGKSQSDGEQSALDLADAQKAVEDAIRATTAANNDLLSLTGKIQSESDNYSKSMMDLGSKQVELQGKLDTLKKQGWWPTSQAVIDATKAVDDNAQAMAALGDAHSQAMKKIAYDLFVAKLQADGFTDAEFEIALQAGITAGVLDQATVDMARGMNDAASAAAGMVQPLDTAAEAARRLAGEYVVNIRTIYSQTGYASNTTPAGDVFHGHASGGSFLIPQSYGNEGFRMGNGDTASAGEIVTVTPPGKQAQSPGIDYDEFARVLVGALQKAGAR